MKTRSIEEILEVLQSHPNTWYEISFREYLKLDRDRVEGLHQKIQTKISQGKYYISLEESRDRDVASLMLKNLAAGRYKNTRV